MAARQPTSVALDQSTRDQIERAREKLSRGTIKPSIGEVIREGLARGLPLLVADDVAQIVADRDQLWAEAVARFDSSEKWHVDTPALRALCEAEQEDRVTDDAWLPIIAEWLTAPSVTLPDPIDGRMRTEPLDISAGVTTTDVLIGALRMKPGDLNKADAMRAAEVLRQLRYTDVDRVRENGARVRRYRKAGAS